MAQTTLETVSQAQDMSGPVQTGAPALEDDDPQIMRQLQHERASCSGQADLQVRFADVGCGFGGLLVRLSPMYPDKLMVGMEIRDKVSCALLLLLLLLTHGVRLPCSAASRVPHVAGNLQSWSYPLMPGLRRCTACKPSYASACHSMFPADKKQCIMRWAVSHTTVVVYGVWC